MKLVYIDNTYIEYLRHFSNNVKYNKKETRPYVGILLEINKNKYFAPLGSPKEKHLKMKSSIDFIKIENGKLGIINLNNMIPVPQKFVKTLSLTQYDPKYNRLLLNQRRWIMRNKDKITIKTKKLYEMITEKENTIFHKRCNDFKLLEEKALDCKL